MNESIHTGAARAEQLRELHAGNAFLSLSGMVIPIVTSVVWGGLTYVFSGHFEIALLTGLTALVGTLAMEAARRVRTHATAILKHLDPQMGASDAAQDR